MKLYDLQFLAKYFLDPNQRRTYGFLPISAGGENRYFQDIYDTKKDYFQRKEKDGVFSNYVVIDCYILVILEFFYELK